MFRGHEAFGVFGAVARTLELGGIAATLIERILGRWVVDSALAPQD